MSAQRWVIWRCPNDPSHDIGGTLEDRDAECSMCRVGTIMERVVVVPEAEVERLREALRWISEYGTHEGDLLDGHEDAMRNIAQNALDASPASSDHHATPDRDVERLNAEVERLTETLRREIDAAEQRGYQAGYTDGRMDGRADYEPR